MRADPFQAVVLVIDLPRAPAWQALSRIGLEHVAAEPTLDAARL